jgi:hypothetical protein
MEAKEALKACLKEVRDVAEAVGDLRVRDALKQKIDNLEGERRARSKNCGGIIFPVVQSLAFLPICCCRCG